MGKGDGRHFPRSRRRRPQRQAEQGLEPIFHPGLWRGGGDRDRHGGLHLHAPRKDRRRRGVRRQIRGRAGPRQVRQARRGRGGLHGAGQGLARGRARARASARRRGAGALRPRRRGEVVRQPRRRRFRSPAVAGCGAAARRPAARRRGRQGRTRKPAGTAAQRPLPRHRPRSAGAGGAKRGEFEEAGRLLDQLVVDPATPASMRQRAEALSSLARGAGKFPPPAVQASLRTEKK